MTAKFSGQEVSRRGFLRRGGAGLAAGLTALSGCSGLPPLGSRVRYGSVDAPAASDRSVREWLPTPAALPGEDADSGNGGGESIETRDGDDGREAYTVMTYAPAHGSARPGTGGIPRSLMCSYADYVGFHLDDADLAFVGDEVVVLLGDVDVETVGATLDRTGYERDGSYQAYALYSRDDVRRIVGVGDDAMVFARGDEALAELTAFVDARAGVVPRYVDEGPDFRRLLHSAGVRRWGWLAKGSVHTGSEDESLTEDMVGWAMSFDADGEALYFVYTWVFPTGYELTEAGVKAAVDDDDWRVLRAASVDVGVTGRVATIEMRIDRDRVGQEFGTFTAVPFVTWGVTHDTDAERMTFHHEAGDAIPAGQVVVDPVDGDVITEFEDVGDTIDPGDELRVPTTDLSRDTTVRLVWQSPDGDSSSVIFGDEVR